jgi:DNA polymerase III alpha subunit
MCIVRTGYSFKSAIGKLTDVIGRLKELGVSRFAVADTNSTYSFTKLTKLCEGANLNLVYGVELGVSPNPEGKKPSVDKWVFLAKSSLRPLHELVYKGTILPTRDPAITYKCAVEAQDLFKIMGPMTLLESLDEIAPEPRSDLFLGLSAAVPRALVRRLLDRGHQPVALPNNRYPRAADLELYRITLGSSKPGKGSASTQTYPQHILSDDEWCNELSWLPGDVLGQALVNRDKILAECNASIQKAELLVPEKPKTLLDMCQEGALSIGIDLNDQIYSDRLSRELDLIQQKNFEDYFYIVADMMQEARKCMIVGPARGSSGGSLVCYLLGITSVDPIKYDLVFERFIDVTRSDLPDIDVDLSDDNRHLIFDYMEKKYGRNRVARLGSVNTFKAKAVLNIIGSALKIAPWHIRDLETALIKRPDGDPRVGNVIEDTFKETLAGQEFLRKSPESRIAERIEDHPAAAAQHAAGVILTDKPIFEYVGVNGNTRASMCDKRDAEVLNLLKIDALGLSQLSVFERCLKAIGRDEEGNKFIESIPIDEQDALNVLNDMKYSGIFQFVPGTAVNAYVQKLREIGGRIDSVEDICAMTALVRPGPLGSGATDSWIYRKAGIERVRYAHPSLEPILSKTMGVITYQEQILNMGREVAGMSWEDVTGVRKAIAKKMGSVFAEYGEKWREGAHAISGIPYELADKIWQELKEHGSYSFNRSHAMAYALTSYHCCWLKWKYPLEFAAATLDSYSEAHSLIQILRELRDEGVSYIPVDVNHSIHHWSIIDVEGKRTLLGPVQMVDGVGSKSVIEAIKCRKDGKPIEGALGKRLTRATTAISSLDPVRDAFLSIDLKAKNVVSEPQSVSEIQLGDRDVCVFVLVEKVKQTDENDPTIVKKRGGWLKNGDTIAVQGWIRDDTQKIFFKIDCENSTMVKSFVETARPGKSLYAMKGFVPPTFRMLKVTGIRYVGEMK